MANNNSPQDSPSNNITNTSGGFGGDRSDAIPGGGANVNYNFVDQRFTCQWVAGLFNKTNFSNAGSAGLVQTDV